MIAFIVTFLIVFIIGYSLFANRHVNPYIKTHKLKWQNERDYDEYIKWLDKNKGDLPLKEVRMQDDIEVLNEVSKYLNK